MSVHRRSKSSEICVDIPILPKANEKRFVGQHLPRWCLGQQPAFPFGRPIQQYSRTKRIRFYCPDQSRRFVNVEMD